MDRAFSGQNLNVLKKFKKNIEILSKVQLAINFNSQFLFRLRGRKNVNFQISVFSFSTEFELWVSQLCFRINNDIRSRTEAELKLVRHQQHQLWSTSWSGQLELQGPSLRFLLTVLTRKIGIERVFLKMGHLYFRLLYCTIVR